jgi:hypothetical protein
MHNTVSRMRGRLTVLLPLKKGKQRGNVRKAVQLPDCMDDW